MKKLLLIIFSLSTCNVLYCMEFAYYKTSNKDGIGYWACTEDDEFYCEGVTFSKKNSTLTVKELSVTDEGKPVIKTGANTKDLYYATQGLLASIILGQFNTYREGWEEGKYRVNPYKSKYKNALNLEASWGDFFNYHLGR